MIHFHAGSNDAGYMPEGDVETFDAFSDARTYMIAELLVAADSIAGWSEEHDCDDCPCPIYGDDCPESLASTVTFAAEDLNLDNGPEWFASLSDGRSLPVSWWISPCSEEECAPEPDEHSARRADGGPLYVRRFEGLGDVWEVRWHGGATFNVYLNDVECAVFTRYGDDKGNPPDGGQARRFVEEWAADNCTCA